MACELNGMVKSVKCGNHAYVNAHSRQLMFKMNYFLIASYLTYFHFIMVIGEHAMHTQYVV